MFRKVDGSWMMGFSLKFKANPATVELLTICEGLSIAKSHKILHPELETDAHVLKIMIDRADHFPHHELHAITKDVTHLLEGEWTVDIMHAKRDVNMVAHRLVALGLEMEEEKVTHFTPPPCVIKEYTTTKPRYFPFPEKLQDCQL